MDSFSRVQIFREVKATDTGRRVGLWIVIRSGWNQASPESSLQATCVMDRSSGSQPEWVKERLRCSSFISIWLQQRGEEMGIRARFVSLAPHFSEVLDTFTSPRTQALSPTLSQGEREFITSLKRGASERERRKLTSDER